MSSPWARALNTMQPIPCSSSSSSRSPSIQRFRIEYDGWWISSGVPRSRAIVAASCVFAAEYDEMPAYSALPVRTAWSSAIIVSSIGVSGS